VLGKLRALMEEAADAFQFEKALALRDRLQALEALDGRLSLLRRARTRNSFVYPLAGPDGVGRWYLIHRGEVRAVVRVPRTDEERTRAAAAIVSAFADAPPPAVLTGGAVDSVLLVAAWFNKFPDEKAKLLTNDAALKLCGVGACSP
jgi:excinuclease ABC subunit C